MGKLRVLCTFHYYQRNMSREETHHCYCSGGCCCCNRTLENIKQEIHNSIWETAEMLEKLIKVLTLMFTIFFLRLNYVKIFSFPPHPHPLLLLLLLPLIQFLTTCVFQNNRNDVHSTLARFGLIANNITRNTRNEK